MRREPIPHSAAPQHTPNFPNSTTPLKSHPSSPQTSTARRKTSLQKPSLASTPSSRKWSADLRTASRPPSCWRTASMATGMKPYRNAELQRLVGEPEGELAAGHEPKHSVVVLVYNHVEFLVKPGWIERQKRNLSPLYRDEIQSARQPGVRPKIGLVHKTSRLGNTIVPTKLCFHSPSDSWA